MHNLKNKVMEKQVNVPLGEYLELKEFYDQVMHNNKICEIVNTVTCRSINTSITFISKDNSERLFENIKEVIKTYEQERDEMQEMFILKNEEIRKLTNEKFEENKDLIKKSELEKQLQKQLEDIKKLSVWQFIKWRKTK